MSSALRRLTLAPRCLLDKGVRGRYPGRYHARSFLTRARIPPQDHVSHKAPGGAGPTGPDKPGRNIFIWGFIGINTVVFLAWQTAMMRTTHSEKLKSLDASTTFAERQRHDPEATAAMARMLDHSTCSPRNLAAGRWWTLFTRDISHYSPWHLFTNMLLFHTFISFIFSAGVPLRAMCGLALASSLGASAAGLLDMRTRDGLSPDVSSMGARGFAFGLGAAAALMRPHWRVTVLFIPWPTPTLRAAMSWIFALDLLGLTIQWSGYYKELKTNTSHAGHLGGMVAGAAYYFLRLRFRYGGMV